MQFSLRSPVLLTGLGCLVLVGPALPTYGAANPAPRIVGAQMLDRDRDDRADAVRLTYSEPVWHTRDADGRYPFKVGTYRIASVGAAKGSRTVTILLKEKAAKDIGARPPVTYTKTSSRPVLDKARKQAIGQTFRSTRPLDLDGDGYAARDCGPTVRSVHPGAADTPDLGFLDSNCDRIDGDKARALFVSTTGSDANPGTMAAPLLTVGEAVSRAGATALDEDVYLATGDYPLDATLALPDGLGIFGGYAGTGWTRDGSVSTIAGPANALTVTGSRGVALQLLEVTSSSPAATGGSSTVMSVRSGADVRLERVTLRAGAGRAGHAGTVGLTGMRGLDGSPGSLGSCDDGAGAGGAGASGGAAVQAGGRGGDGGFEGANRGIPGVTGAGGVFGGGLGGSGGTGGDPGRPGTAGSPGSAGARGADGASRNGYFSADGWLTRFGEQGTSGQPGFGGGGGGGGGGQGGFLVDDGGGNGGGGGGGGGFPGGAATPGSGGGGSIAALVWESSLTLVESTLVAGDGGRGGDGALGGVGGTGGRGGPGAAACTGEIGAGGSGGPGGSGGTGGASGAGQGGPSVALVHSGATVVRDATTALMHGNAGAGGTSPAGGASNGQPGMAAEMHEVI